MVIIINNLSARYFNQQQVFVSEATNQQDVFNEVCTNLLDCNLVTDDFLEHLLKREERYPTGIDTSPIDSDLPNIALPHTEVEFVNQELIVPIKLIHPIDFKNMLIPKQTMPVGFLFMILNHKSNNQTNLLSDIMTFIANTDRTELINFFNLTDKTEIYNFLTEHFR